MDYLCLSELTVNKGTSNNNKNKLQCSTWHAAMKSFEKKCSTVIYQIKSWLDDFGPVVLLAQPTGLDQEYARCLCFARVGLKKIYTGSV